MSKKASNFFPKKLKRTIGCPFPVFLKGAGGSWQTRKQNSCTASVDEIKIVHSETKQKNTSQASEIELIQIS